VCHDVLVSSFLCPIGSTFSQKLLTCDWWTKVDCSSTSRYLEMNRNSYQIDDDEMIRNAYAMISLQSSAEDVTKDGLVDPDSGTRIIDYSALGVGRTSYTPGFRRITDYAAVDATGNDLPNGFEDYPHQDSRQIFTYERYDQQKKAHSNVYGKFQMENKGRSPYHASPIIQHNYQHRTADNDFQVDYRRPDGFTNQLQASYAPTVPTVTTTTRRLYSPTVPTTYRPSTLASNKLDLMMDSSDHLYARSKSSVTPPTTIHYDNDAGNVDSRESETRHGREGDLKESDTVPSSRTDREDGIVHSKNDEVHLNFEEKSETSFRINVTDMIEEDEIFRQQNDRPLTQNDKQDSLVDIETKDSIGIARALSNSPGRIIVQNQNPIDQLSKSEQRDLTTPVPLQTGPSHSSDNADIADSSQTWKKSNTFSDTGNDRSTESYGDVIVSTTNSPEETTYRSFGDRTTSLLRNWKHRDSVVQPSIISMTATSAIEKNVNETYDEYDRSSINCNRTFVNQNLSTISIESNNEPTPRINLNFEVPQPAQFLKPPVETFLINVPEEARYATIDGNFKTSWNPGTITKTFSNTPAQNDQHGPPSYNENIEEESLIDYDENIRETSRLGIRPVAQVETTTSSPWLTSTWPDQSILNVPVTDIVPPIVDYNDGFGDFVPPHEHTDEFDNVKRTDSQRTQDSSSASKKNNETEVLRRYNSGFAFTIRDAINAQLESRVDPGSPCSSSTSGEQTRFCEQTNSAAPGVAVSTPSVHERTISIGTKANTRIPERFFSSSSAKLAEAIVSSEFPTSTTQSLITINVSTEDPILKTITPRKAQRIGDPSEQVENTANISESNLPHSRIRSESLKQIEDTIDKHNSPYEISFAVKRNEDLQPDDFISRLIAQHQRPASVLNEKTDEFEIVRSLEPEYKRAGISQLPKLADASRAFPEKDNNSFSVPVDDSVADGPKQNDSNVSMLTLLQLMAELLKLDRLPRPFSTKNLRSLELKDSFNLNLDESSSVAVNPVDSRNANSKAFAFDTLKSANIAESKASPNLNIDKSFVTVNPPFDYSQRRTSFGDTNLNTPPFDISETPPSIVRSKVSVNPNRNKPSSSTTDPLLDRSQVRTSFEDAKSKASIFDSSQIPVNTAQSKTLLNLGLAASSFVRTTPLLDYTQSKKPFANTDSEGSSFDVIPTASNGAFEPFPDISFRINSDNITEQGTNQSKSENKTSRPLQKEEILEQLAENFGQPLYRGHSIHKSLIFDLPQVQRSLDFESGLPMKESEDAIDKEQSPFTRNPTTTESTTTTTESVKTIVETEFVPSLGFSFDTNEGREEYVQAILGGLIDEHTDNDSRNESSTAQLTDRIARNATSGHEQHENL